MTFSSAFRPLRFLFIPFGFDFGPVRCGAVRFGSVRFGVSGLVCLGLVSFSLAWLDVEGRPGGCDQGGVHDRRQDGGGQGAFQVPGKEQGILEDRACLLSLLIVDITNCWTPRTDQIDHIDYLAPDLPL